MAWKFCLDPFSWHLLFWSILIYSTQIKPSDVHMSHFLSWAQFISLSWGTGRTYQCRYLPKKVSTKLKVFLTSRSTSGTERSPFTVQPCFMSGNSMISTPSASTFWPRPPTLNYRRQFRQILELYSLARWYSYLISYAISDEQLHWHRPIISTDIGC